MIGVMPTSRAAWYMSRTPYMLPWSVIPIAGWPSFAAAATTSPIRDAPSSIEYSVCTWRWTNDLLTALWTPVDNLVDELHRCKSG